MFNYIKNKLIGFFSATFTTEKNIFGGYKEILNEPTQSTWKVNQGTLADSLVKGEITDEVKRLRWRTYNIIRNTGGLTAEIVGYEEDGTPIVKTKKRNTKKALKKIKIDDYDNYPLEIVFYNDPIPLSTDALLDNKYIGEDNTIGASEFFATNKTEKPIYISRNVVPKFDIEKYTNKLNVRVAGRNKRLLEFYISMYADEYKTTRLILSEIKKIAENPHKSSVLEINNVEFVSYKTLGSEDFLLYEYEIINFDKIVTFDGHFVIKFLAKVKKNGEDLFEKYREEDLDKKYKNKERKIN
jgi:hypothetical protein